MLMIGVFLHSSRAWYMLVFLPFCVFINVLTIATADSTLHLDMNDQVIWICDQISIDRQILKTHHSLSLDCCL